MEKQGLDQEPFDHGAAWLKVRITSYWLKIVFCFLGAIWLIIVVSVRALELM